MMARKPDADDELAESDRQWSQHDLDLLHEMVRDYDRAKWLKGQLKWWVTWALGLPVAIVSVWKAIEELWKLLHR